MWGVSHAPGTEAAGASTRVRHGAAAPGVRIAEVRLSRATVGPWAAGDQYLTNWPVVYTLTRRRSIYVGESLNVASRLRQHLASDGKKHLDTVRVIVDERFNKSAALDLESMLIRLFAGDGWFTVLNRNDGVTDADYFDRDEYRTTFDEVFDRLLRDGVLTRPVPEIMNGDLFKFSPFKALSGDQAIAVEEIVEGLLRRLLSGEPSTAVVQGEPGTGKTVIAIYLIKLLRDIAAWKPTDLPDGDSAFAEFFTEDSRELLRSLRIGLVVPQQSLRTTIQRVFAKTPELDRGMVLTPFEVGESPEPFDLLIVDETHRLNQRANQASGPLNKKFATINERLFRADDDERTQLDWIIEQSRHRILLLDSAQRVRPADLPRHTLDALTSQARKDKRWYPLRAQMRIKGGADVTGGAEYVAYVRQILGPVPPEPRSFDGYDLRLFDDLAAMYGEVRRRDAEAGLARLVAGYAWPWRSKDDPLAYDVEIGSLRLRWNRVQRDWITSAGSLDEVGSIHTVQGYDLNYAGVVIGPDLRYDPRSHRLVVDRDSYHDTRGKENNRRRGIVYGDDDLLEFIRNIYGVLLTRGICGTYVYACDPALREYLREFLPAAPSGRDGSPPAADA